MAITPNYDLDVDTSLGGADASDYVISSQKAIKAYVDNNSGTPSNYVTTDTAQDITGTKTYVGQKKIEFKQSAAADKLGFTCFNTSNTEIGAFEYRPSTIGSGALFNINVPYSSTSYVGFRYWGTAVNVVAPKVATAGTYYIPTHITDGTNTVTASNQGTVDISSLDVANTNLTNVPHVSQNLQFREGLKLFSNWGFIGLDTSNSTSDEVLNITDILPLDDSVNPSSSVTLQVNGNTILDGASGLIPDARLSSNIARTSQIPSISNLADKDLSNLSATGEAKIKEIFVATYGTTTHQEVLDAYNAGKTIICKYLASVIEHIYVLVRYEFDINGDFVFSQSLSASTNYNILNTARLDTNDNWSVSGIYLADTTALDSKVNKSGDTMTGKLSVPNSLKVLSTEITTKGTTPASTSYSSVEFRSSDNDDTAWNTSRLGILENTVNTDNSVETSIRALSNTAGSNTQASITVSISSGNVASCTFPNTTCVDGKWVNSLANIISTDTSLNGSTQLSYTISSLPSNYSHEVLFSCTIETTAGSANWCALQIKSDYITNFGTVARTRTWGNNKGFSGAVFIMPVSSSKKIYIPRSTSWNGVITSLQMLGYRRIGSNS